MESERIIYLILLINYITFIFDYTKQRFFFLGNYIFPPLTTSYCQHASMN
jgi:hypothetical protein